MDHPGVAQGRTRLSTLLALSPPKYDHDYKYRSAVVAELRAAGYVELVAGLAPGGRELKAGASDPVLPDELCARVLQASEYRYRPYHGYLGVTSSSAAPHPAAAAFRIYGAELMLAALNDEDGPKQAAIPGQDGLRRRHRLWQRWKRPVICVAAPFIGPLAAAGLAALVLVALVWPALLTRGDTLSHAGARSIAVFYASVPAAVFTLAAGAWFWLNLPPAGTARWVVAVEVAGIAMFAVLPVWLPVAVFAVAGARSSPGGPDRPRLWRRAP